MTLLSRVFVVALYCSSLSIINGCTVLGIVADNAVFDNEQRHRPLMQQHRLEHREMMFGQLGLETDIAIVKKVIEAVKGKPEQQKIRCKVSNGIRFCYEEGAEGY